MTATASRPPARHDEQAETAEPQSRAATTAVLAAEILLHLVLIALALLAYEPVFGSLRRYAGPTYGGAAIATMLAVMLRRRALPARFAVLASLVGVALYLAYTVLVGELTAGVVPGRDTMRALRDGLAHGWQDVLARPLPVEDATNTRVWLATVTWVATHLTVDLVLRTRLAAIPLAFPLVLFGLSLPLVSGVDEPSMWLVAAIVVVALVVVLVRSTPEARPIHRTGPSPQDLAEFHSRSVLSARLRLGLPIVALAAVVAPLLGALVTTRDPFDPRELRAEVVLPQSVSDPLGQLKAQIKATPQLPAFRISFGAPEDALEVRRVSVLHLDRYDGVRWTSTGRFADASNPLLDETDAGPGRDVVQHYTIGSTREPWLPVAGRPLRTDLPQAAYDEESGDLLTSGTVSGLSYEVVSRVFTPTPERLASAERGRGADLARYQTLEGQIPEEIRTAAVEATAGATSDGDALLRLEQYVSSRYAYDEEAPPGHSYGRLVNFLTTDRRGTAEQFAAAYAVLARAIGFPARVVVGYKVVDEVDGTLQPLEFVTSEQYHAWVEVNLAELGWVAIDPTPRPGEVPLPEQSDEPPATTIAPAEQPSGQRTPQEAGPSEGLPEVEPPEDGVATRAIAVGAAIVAGVLLLVLAAAGAILAAKALRRRRRRLAPTPADQVVGAWDEVLDRLLEMQFPIGSSMTPRDVERVGRATYGAAATEPLSRLVPTVSRAVFAREVPGPDTAEEAWRDATVFEQNLTATLTLRQRIRTRLSLRPFRRVAPVELKARR